MGSNCSQQLFGVVNTGDPLHLVLFMGVLIIIVIAIWKLAKFHHVHQTRKVDERERALLSVVPTIK